MSSAVPRPRTRLGLDERRRQLLELGWRLFNERPYDEISIDDIAQEAGVSKGLLYHYFSSKRRFYVETVRTAFDEMRRMTEPNPDLPPLEQLDQSLDAYLDYVEANGLSYEMLQRSGIGSDPEVAALVEEQRQVVISRVLRGLSLDNPTPAIRTALRGWLGFIDAACLDWVAHRDLDRTAVRTLLSSSLQAALLTAVQVDPAMNVALPELDENTSATEASARIALAIAQSNR